MSRFPRIEIRRPEQFRDAGPVGFHYEVLVDGVPLPAVRDIQVHARAGEVVTVSVELLPREVLFEGEARAIASHAGLSFAEARKGVALRSTLAEGRWEARVALPLPCSGWLLRAAGTVARYLDLLRGERRARRRELRLQRRSR